MGSNTVPTHCCGELLVGWSPISTGSYCLDCRVSKQERLGKAGQGEEGTGEGAGSERAGEERVAWSNLAGAPRPGTYSIIEVPMEGGGGPRL